MKKTIILFDWENGYYKVRTLSRTVYRAVSEENALRRCEKDFPGEGWRCTKIYDYRAM